MIKLEFTEQELQVLSLALGQLPYGQVVSLIANINAQIAEQQKKLKSDPNNPIHNTKRTIRQRKTFCRS